MRIQCVISFAGLALASTSAAQAGLELSGVQLRGEAHAALRATAIKGLTVDGQYVFGETIELASTNTPRNLPGTVAYDSFQAFDTDLDGINLDLVCGDTAPHTLSSPSSRYFLNTTWQSVAEDLVPAPGTEGQSIQSVAFLAARPLCDGGAGTVSEVCQLVIESWEGFDTFPDLDGTDGFDTDADGLGFPADLSDNDGDTFVDGFLGGVILTYANTDTDGDTIPDAMLYSGGLGVWYATGLETLAIPLTSNLDQFDGGKPGADGRGDGGVRVLWTRGDGGDGMGPLFGGLYPASKITQPVWGTLAMEAPGNMCPYAGQPGFGVGDSDAAMWGEGENICGDSTIAWSDGGPSGNAAVDNQYDIFNDLQDWGNVVPDFNVLGAMLWISVEDSGGDVDCCDANMDGQCTPADFSAWIAAFNANSGACDANQDGSCTPADFSAWIAAFNASQAGNPMICSF